MFIKSWCSCFHLWTIVLESSSSPLSLQHLITQLQNKSWKCWAIIGSSTRLRMGGLFLEASQCPHVRMWKSFHWTYQCERSDTRSQWSPSSGIQPESRSKVLILNIDQLSYTWRVSDALNSTHKPISKPEPKALLVRDWGIERPTSRGLTTQQDPY